MSSLVFVAGVAATIRSTRSMSDDRAMPGESPASAIWTRMPDQSWLGSAASFMAMWTPMMVAMMLPALVPALASYRRSVAGLDEPRPGWRTALAGGSYFLVWVIVGAIAYGLGGVLVGGGAPWSWAPAATGVAVLLAGSIQLTAWKARQLGHCRDAPVRAPSPSSGGRAAWRYGLSLGGHCVLCCAGYMLVLLVSGMSNLGTMALVAAAITVERLAPRPERAARAAGVVFVVAGAVVTVRALGRA